MKRSKQNINNVLKGQLETMFVKTVADFNNFESTKEFLKDFLTKSEFEALTKRLAIAYWLKKGRSYENIKTNLKVSSATISAVASIMETKGVCEAIKKTEAEEWASKWSERIKQFVGSSVK